MGKVFYDNLLHLDEVGKHIKMIARTEEEREELYGLVDEIVHHRVLGIIFDKLPNHHHKEFVSEFSKRPHDESLFEFLSERIAEDIKEFIQQEMYLVTTEILAMIADDHKPRKR